jgi:hypothetical protein
MGVYCLLFLRFTALGLELGLRHAMNGGSWQDLDPAQQMHLVRDKMLGVGSLGGPLSGYIGDMTPMI